MFSIKKHDRSITYKVIITCLLALSAICSSLYISNFTFSRILTTIHNLSQPNPRIQLVNSLFRNVVKLDQLQRNQTFKTEQVAYNPFIKESEQIQQMLDSLRDMSLQSSQQIARIDSMKKILYRRDILFLNYIKLSADRDQNEVLSSQVKKLSDLIANAETVKNGNLVTTSRATKTIIDTIKQDAKKRTLWHRIFSKKKKDVQQVQKKIEEDIDVRVDTIGITNNGDSITKAGKAITLVETGRIEGRNKIVKKQTELNRTGDLLIAQLISILNDIDKDEMAHSVQQNAAANMLVSDGVIKIGAVLFAFILGTAILVFFIFTDIARSNRYRKELVIAKEEAEEAGAVKQRFLANMSHELRTPLQTIIGVSEQLRSVKDPAPDVENIYRSSMHLLQIVNEVLDYSKIISGKYVVESMPFNMLKTLEEVKEMMLVQARLKGLHLSCNINVQEEANYVGDAFRLKQVLLNLIGNSIKFTDEGTVTLSVNEEENVSGTTQFKFTIQDTGIGIAEKDMPLIFNQFEQVGSAAEQKGTGLGLSIVKALIDMQGGSIGVQSRQGEGTMFTIYLRYENAGRELIRQDVLADVKLPYSGYVWVVDDDQFILQLCDSILTKNDVPHTCFSSALTALNTTLPQNLSTVFLDIRMQEMDGITLCTKLKEKAGSNPPQFIALTAQALPDEREDILDKGFDALVVKPFLEHEFLNAIYKKPSTVQQDSSLIPDLSAVYRMTGDDPVLIDKVLKSFIKETEEDLVILNEALLHEDADKLADVLHKLATRCGQIGVSMLAAHCRDMEISLRNKDNFKDATVKAGELKTQIAAMIVNLKSVLNKSDIPS